MTQPTEFDAEIQDLTTTKQEMEKRLAELYQKRAEFLCPFHVGDRIVNKKGHKGIVTDIKPDYHNLESYYDGYRIFYVRVLKSGDSSRIQHTVYDWDGWKKEDSNERQ